MEIVIRYTTNSDYPVIRKILWETWLNAYSFIPEEDLRTYLDAAYNDQQLILLVNNKANQSIITEVNKTPVSWMRLNNNESELRFYISSIYVLPEYQGYGIGRKLFSFAEKEAVKNNYDRIWLGVMTENIKAVEWYRKIGFVFVEEEPFKMGNSEVMHLIGYKII